MPDATFDAVIIGAGHNGLTLAAYLARAGLSVGVFERRHEDGGGADTEEATVPGFHHNLHAQYMEFIDYMPVYHDFELERLGARMIYPEVQLGITFADGRPPIVVYRPDLEEQTHKSIAHYSKHDADVWCELKRKVMAKDRALARMLYSSGEEDGSGQAAAASFGAVMGLWAELGFTPADLGKAPKVLIDQLFESPELRTLLYRQCVEWGANVHAGNGAGFLISVLWLSAIHKMSVGGTHTLAHAMANAAMKQGVCLRFTKPVVRITMCDGRAAGVQLKDGTQIAAKMLVASNVDPKQTFIDCIGEEHLQPFRRERLAHWRFGPEHVLGTPSFALREAPAYKSARWNADIDRCFYTLVGFETPEQMSEYIIQAYGGAIPSRPGAGTWVNSLWDSTQAPPGKHAMNGWFFFPRASCLTPREWDEVRCTFNDKFLRLWGEYAPNMTRENVIAQRLYTSFDMERKIGMPEGDFSHGRAGGGVGAGFRDYQYRTEIPGLYLCGASAGGGGISAAPGYNAFKVICRDYGLPKVWQQPCRDYWGRSTMADIYTQPWYESLKEILNRSDDVTKHAPRGVWHVLAEIHGDGPSPYLAPDEHKRFSIVLNDGKCDSYEELSSAPPRKDFEFILQLPASLFERIVANLADPVEAGLKGAIKITGDMRVLIQNAELVNVLSEIYQREVATDWPKGRPPYPGEAVAAASQAAGAAS